MNIKILYSADKSQTPSNLAVSSARTCYFPGGIVEPGASEGWKSKSALLSSVFEAGHHTTLQHAHFTILIEGMSRHLIWRLMHSHPYYNSEQVSQRYAKMKPDAFVYPKDGDQSEWSEFYDYLFRSYEELIGVLEPIVKAVLPKFKQKESVKKAQELARYILPQGMSAYFYHTINLVTALRYVGAAKAMPECSNEAKEFVTLLEEEILKIDPELKPLFDFAKEEKAEFFDFDMGTFKKEKNIKNETVKIFDIVDSFDFDARQNYSSVLRFSQMIEDPAVLGGFSSYLKISLSADAQNQRHRRSFAVRPKLESGYKRDYYIPQIIQKNSLVLERYKQIIEKTYDFFEKQVKKIGFDEAVYALPNAHLIEIIERNDFAAFHHKAQMRLCYNAQQEIFDAVYDQVSQLRASGVRGATKFLPPCSIRSDAGIFPICPEGPRFCGTKVWKKDFDEIKIREI
jgi:thymidylate synthase ThyX